MQIYVNSIYVFGMAILFYFIFLLKTRFSKKREKSLTCLGFAIGCFKK